MSPELNEFPEPNRVVDHRVVAPTSSRVGGVGVGGSAAITVFCVVVGGHSC